MIPAFLFLSFNALLLAGMPAAYAMGAATLGALLLGGYPLQVIPQILARSVMNQSVLAVPLFILAGNIMNRMGLTERIFRFARAMAGHLPGGLAHVNIIASVIFAGISGSAAADCAGLGPMEIRAMTAAGYRKPFSAALTVASSCVGPIIPPSIPFIVYGVLAEVSIARLFLGGFLPGLLIAFLLMATVHIHVLLGREHCPVDPRTPWRKRIRAFREGFAALLTPVVIVGGMAGGILTPGEAGIAAVLCSLAAGAFHGHLRLSECREILEETVLSSAHVLVLLGMASVFGYVLTQERTPVLLAEWILSFTKDRNLVLLLILLVLLLVGCFMSGTAALIVLTPVFLPLVKEFGIDLVHFGLVMTLGLTIGIATPPVGIGLFIVSDVAEIEFGELVRATLPFLVPLSAALLLVTYFPEIVLFLPKLLMG